MESPLSGARVILAEPGQGDDLVSPLLEGTGAIVVRVFSAEDLLHRLHREKIDLVVIDSRFDHPDPVQLVRDARNKSRAASLGIVLASGRDEETRRREALAAGATELLVRPLCPAEGVRRLDSAVRLRRAIGHAAQLEADRLRTHAMATDLLARLSHVDPTPAPGWRVSVRHEPAPIPAGDFHDTFAIGDGRFVCCAGDVPGSGTDALVRVAAVRTAVRMAATGADSAASIVARTHRVLRGMWPEGDLVKLHVGIVDPAGGILAHCAGGSDAAWVLSRDGQMRPMLDGGLGGPPLGALDESAWQDARVAVEPGACILVATDGCWNARDARGGFVGRDRFEAILREAAMLRGDQLLDALLDGVSEATGGVPPTDDRTLLAIAREE